MKNTPLGVSQSFITIFILLSSQLLSQEISGIVQDSDGNPLIGANVIILGGEMGMATDENGTFSFEKTSNKDLQIMASYIGYKSKTLHFVSGDILTDISFTLLRKHLFGKEVTVLARRREESIKDVPVSMVAISENMIREMGASSLEDLTSVVPNVFTYEEQTSTSFNIRGITGGARNPGMSSAEGVYLDGVIMGRPEFIATDMVDIKSVEFLRGPQGTLFGRNTVSGAINMISTKPGPTHSKSALFEIGQNGYQKIRLAINSRLNEKVFTRFSIYDFKWDGYLKNAFNNSQEKFKNNTGVRWAIRAIPSSKLTLDFSLDYYKEDLNKIAGHISDWRYTSSSPGYDGLPLDSLYYSLDSIDITDDGIYSFNNDTTGVLNRLLLGATFNMNYEIKNRLNIVGLVSWRKSDVSWFNDEDHTGIKMLNGYWDNQGDQTMVELKLMSNQNKKITWLSGLFYYNLYHYLNGPVYPQPYFFHYATGIPMFIAKNYTDQIVAPEGGGNTASVGLYGSADIQVSEKLSFTLGARYSTDKMRFKYRQIGIPSFGYITFPEDTSGDGVPDSYFDSTKTWSAFTPTLNVRYAYSPEFNMFGTISKGYKSGGFNADYISSIKSVTEPFKPEQIINYEAGFKLGNESNTLFINSALYRMEYKDMQVSQFQDLFEGYSISNAGSSTITGFEIDFSSRLLRKALTLTGGYGQTEAIFNEFHDGYFNGDWDDGELFTDENGNGEYDSGEEFIDQDNNFSGEHISMYPKRTWSIVADFRVPINANLMFVSQLRSDFIDEKLSQLTIDKDANLLRDDARTLVNGHIGIAAEKWDISLWGENLFNTEYIVEQGINGYMGFIEQLWGQPRLLGLRISYRM